MSIDTGPKLPLDQPPPPPPDFGGATREDDMVWLNKRPDRGRTRLTYTECVCEGVAMLWLVFSAILVIALLPITLPLAGLGYLALREDRDA